MDRPRKIIHIDMDAFFALVEMRDNPSLQNKPVAVGGFSSRRGVIATANYKARKYGVRSAIPTWQALRCCPDLQVVPSHIEKYKRESQEIRAIFNRYTDIIEPLSLDEAFLDVTECPYHNGSATLIAEAIRAAIKKERHLTASGGVAPNKFLAKVASDWNKPDGQYVIPPEGVAAFVRNLPVCKISGAGPVTVKQFERLGVRTCGDLQEISLRDLEQHFGSRAGHFYGLARGSDNRPVNPDRIRKSTSVEQTYETDLPTLEACLAAIPKLHERLLLRLENIGDTYQFKGLRVKMKFHDFTSTTVEAAHLFDITIPNFEDLLEKAWERKGERVRLLGLGVYLSPIRYEQLTLW